MGRLQDRLRYWGLVKTASATEPELTKDFVPLYQDYESFFTRNVYRRIRDCWNQPIGSVPGAHVTTIDRISKDHGWTFQYTGTTRRVINMASYNYLGFAENFGPCAESSCSAMDRYGVGVCSARQEVGSLDIHRELEQLVAEFVGQEAAIVFGMGFATNALNLPALLDKDCCVISDKLNHTSLILGCRLAGCHIRTFAHNNMSALETQLLEAVVSGHPRTHRRYSKIIIVVEGMYSMEGSVVRLPELLALKRKYKAYLYLDEAHSMGAMGPRGRGVVDHFGVDPREVDVSMGTFTKSFGSCGGYLAGSRHIVEFIRCQSHSSAYGGSMPGTACQQIVTAMRILMGREWPGEGSRRIAQLAWNTRYFRRGLHRLGLIVYGHRDSPVVPAIFFTPCKIAAFSREALARGLGTAVVAFPATPPTLARARFCISASHTKEMIDQALSIIDELADLLSLRSSRLPPPPWVLEPEMSRDPSLTDSDHSQHESSQKNARNGHLTAPVITDK